MLLHLPLTINDSIVQWIRISDFGSDDEGSNPSGVTTQDFSIFPLLSPFLFFVKTIMAILQNKCNLNTL